VVKHQILVNSLKEMVIDSNNKVVELQSNRFYQLANWTHVADFLGISKFQSNIEQIEKTKLSIIKRVSVQQNIITSNNNKSQMLIPSRDEIVTDARYRMLRTFKGLVWEKAQQGFITPTGYRLLEEATAISLDEPSSPIQLWDYAFLNFSHLRTLRFFFRLKDYWLIGRLASHWITHHLALVYEIATTFVQCA
jgi:hypothetical protein